MKKGIFGSWFGELATMVFTQTIQAFLLSIVMSIIIAALGKTTGSSDQNGSTAAAGLLAIIALSQFGKIELLIKNIFGVTSRVADVSMNAGKGGLTAGKMLAMRGAGRLMDNGRKISQGIKSFKTGSEIKNVKSQLGEAEAAKDLQEKNLNTFNTALEEGTTTPGGKTPTSGDDAANATMIAGSVSEAIGRLETAIRAQTAQQERNRQEDNISKLTEKLEKLNEERHSQRKEGISGIAETGLGAYGAAAGLSVGLAQGDNMIETTFAGAGAGDKLGDSLVDAGDATIKAGKGMGKIASNVGKRQSNMKKSIESAQKASNDAIKEIQAEIDKATEAQNDALVKQLQNSQEQIKTNYKNYLGDLQKKSGIVRKGPTKKTADKVLKNNPNLYDVGKDM